LWNFGASYSEIFLSDTVGAVALDRQGRFAVAVSTGGASPMLLGRVGDVPFVGCGFYAGKSAAVAVTGIGEEIVRKMLSKTIYDKIVAGVALREACRQGLALFSETVPIGIIALSGTESAILSNRKMPSARVVHRAVT
jgi:L-asparaginase/beta-aspartyl-peptidase (threonine type)